MFAKERQNAIIDILKKNKSVTVSELCSKFDISAETVRRDLLLLENEGMLQRAHGGAILHKRMTGFATLKERMEENMDMKKELCFTAAKLIENNDIVAIESGSTAIEFAKIISDLSIKITVITNSPDIAECLHNNDNISVFITGGIYDNNERVLFGNITLENIMSLHADKCFVFPSAISLEYGAFAADDMLCGISKAYIKISENTFFLCDSSKFETASFVKISDIKNGKTIVTDSMLKNEIKKKYIENGVKIIDNKL